MGIVEAPDGWMQHCKLIDCALTRLRERRLIVYRATFAEDGHEQILEHSARVDGLAADVVERIDDRTRLTDAGERVVDRVGDEGVVIPESADLQDAGRRNLG